MAWLLCPICCILSNLGVKRTGALLSSIHRCSLVAMASAKSALLPSKISDFRSPEFWRTFFAARKGKAFEWYGSWENFGGNIVSAVDANEGLHDVKAGAGKSAAGAYSNLKVLVIGCGNSEMSWSMYKAGFTDILNVDFDAGVIAEMSAKHPQMQWKTADVTEMSFLADNSFHLVVDKGTLDAMLTDESAEVTGSVDRMMSEVSRVLQPHGLYITITLAQQHLATHYAHNIINSKEKFGRGWEQLVVETFKQLDYTSAGLQFVFTAKKGDITCGKTGILLRSPETYEPLLPSPLLSSKGRGGKGRGGKERRGEGTEGKVEETRGEDVSDILSFIAQNQWGFNTFKSVSSIAPGQYTKVDIWQSSGEGMILTPSGQTPANVSSGVGPRYSISIVDVSLAYSAAVVLVPQGREHEWSFGSQKGQEELARSTRKYGRVFFVCLNRGHAFLSQKSVQEELSRIVTRLIPAEMRNSASSIPFLAVAEDIGKRTLVATGNSPLSGDFVIEDVEVEEDGGHATARRLIFMTNQNAIQTECTVETAGGFKHHDLRFDYQKEMVAAFARSWTLQHELARPVNVLILGLGGGTLPSFISKAFANVRVACVDLDEAVVDVATKYFGFSGVRIEAVPGDASYVRKLFESETTVTVADGIRVVQDLQKFAASPMEKADIIIVDVDAKDSRSGLSFPPLPFLQKEFLTSCFEASNDDGLLLVNFACRVKALQAGIMASLLRQFGNAESISSEDSSEANSDINSVLCARVRPSHDKIAPAVFKSFIEKAGTDLRYVTKALECVDEHGMK